MLILSPGATTLEQLETVYRQGVGVRLSDDCRAPVEAAQAIVARAAEDRARKQAGDSDPRTTGEDERDGVASGRPAMT